MMPPYSWSTPGRNPGTSTNVTSGMLKASQVRTKRAAFSELSMSSTPASTIGWLPTTPTGEPSSRANPHTIERAQWGKYSKNSPSSATAVATFFMSYGWFELAGSRSRSVGQSRSGSSDGSTTGGSSRLFDGRNDMRYRTSSRHDFSSGATNVATPDLVAWLMAPPSSSSVTSSPVTVFTTSGPVMNMCDVSRTMKMKSVMAGLYTAPPAHGPRITLICGTTPDDSTLR